MARKRMASYLPRMGSISGIFRAQFFRNEGWYRCSWMEHLFIMNMFLVLNHSSHGKILISCIHLSCLTPSSMALLCYGTCKLPNRVKDHVGAWSRGAIGLSVGGEYGGGFRNEISEVRSRSEISG